MRSLRRRLVLGALVVALIGGELGCAPKYTDPQTQAAATAKHAVQLFSDLGFATMQAVDTGGMPADTGIVIVRFTQSAIRTVQQTPYGWGPSVAQGWTEIKTQVGAHPALAPYIPTIDALLRALGGPQ